MAAQRVGGIAYFKIDGAQYSIKGKFEIMPFKTKKTSFIAQDGVVGFTETPVTPGMKGTITDLGGVSVSALQNLEGSTMTLEQNNGKVWVLSDGWCEGEITVGTEEGTYDAEFRGMDMQEQTV